MYLGNVFVNYYSYELTLCEHVTPETTVKQVRPVRMMVNPALVLCRIPEGLHQHRNRRGNLYKCAKLYFESNYPVCTLNVSVSDL